MQKPKITDEIIPKFGWKGWMMELSSKLMYVAQDKLKAGPKHKIFMYKMGEVQHITEDTTQVYLVY